MPSVDNRVVEMRFDNNDFETDVSESISSLDKLKRALDFRNAGNGMDELARSTDAVSVKFTALNSIADQFFRNIGNEIYSLKNQFVGLVKSLSVDQISEGWSKYATKTEAVQTIMAATANQIQDEGERMAYVNEQLERLNWFTDETSYSLVDMTNNIGKFTNNGQDLAQSVTAMQGIATWAGVSGAKVAEASRAMYNLSQALSVGAVTLIDWKSIENANMATVEFKQTAIDTAVALGTLKKNADGTYKTLKGNEVTLEKFNQYLTSDKWFNKDVLMQTLDKYGGFADALAKEMEKVGDSMSTSKFISYIDQYLDGTLNIKTAAHETGLSAEELMADLKRLADEEYALGRKAFRAAQEAKTFQEAIDATKDAVSSGWMTTFERIFGDYQNAKQLWTKLSNELWDVFAGGAAARNDMLAEWSEWGGYKKLWDSIWNIWDGLKGIGARIGEIWNRVFPSIDLAKLQDWTNKLEAFSLKFKERFAIVEEAVESLSTAVETYVPKIKKGFDKMFISDNPDDMDEQSDQLSEYVDSVDENVKRLAATLEHMDELTIAVNSGKYGSGENRRKQLEEEGYSYELIQNRINELYGSTYRYAIAEEDLANAQKYLNGELVVNKDNLDELKATMHDASDEGEHTRDWVDDLKDVLGGFKSALDLVVGAAKLAAKYIVLPVWNALVRVFKAVLKIMAPFSRAFTNFVNKLKESGTVTKNIEKLIQWFKDLAEYLKNQENTQKFLNYIEELKTKLSDFKNQKLEQLMNFFDKMVGFEIELPSVDSVGTWADKMIGYINPAIDRLGDLKGIWESIKSFFQGLDFGSVKTFGKSLGEGIGEFFTSLFTNEDMKEASKGWFKTMWENLQADLAEIDFMDLLSTVFKAVSGATLIKLGFSVAKFFSSIGNVVNGSAGFFGALGDVLASFSKTLRAAAFLEAAVGVGILAAAMIALSKIQNPKVLYDISVSLAAIVLAFSVLIRVLGVFTKGNKVTTTIGTVSVNLNNMAMKLIGLGLALIGLAVAVKAINKVQQLGGNLQSIFIFIGSIFAAFTLFDLILMKSMKVTGTSGKQFMAIGAEFALIAFALNLMVPAIASLAGIQALNADALGAAVLSIMGILVAFGYMARLSRDTTSAISVATAFGIMAVAFMLFIPSIVALMTAVQIGGIGPLIAAVLGIIFIVGAFTGAIAALASIDNKALNLHGLENATKAIYAISVALLAIGVTLRIVEGIHWSTIGQIVVMLVAIGAVFGVLALGASKLNGFAQGMLLVSIGLAAFGASILLAGVGVLAFAKALKMLSDASMDAKTAGRNLGEGVAAFFDSLVENGKSIIAFVALVLGAIITVIIAHKAKITDLGSNLLTALSKGLVDGMGKSKVLIIAALAILLVGILDWLGIKVETIVDALFKIIILIINSLSLAIINNGSDLFQALVNLFTALGSLIVSAIEGLINAIGGWLGIENAAKKLGFDTAEWFAPVTDNIHAQQEEIRAGLKTDGDEIKEGFTLFGDKLEEAGESYADGFQGMRDKILSASGSVELDGKVIEGDALTKLQEGFFTGAINENNIHDYINELGTTVDNNEGLLSGLGEKIGSYIGLGTADGINLNSDLVSGAIEDMDMDALAQMMEDYNINSPSKKTMAIGENVAEGLAQGIENKTSLVSEAVRKMINAVSSAQQNSSLYNAGVNAVEGFTSGLLSRIRTVKEKAEQIGQVSIDATADAIDAHSPSREFMKLGQYAVEGYAQGMDQNLRLGTDEAELFGDKVLNAFNSVVSRIVDAINGNIDMSPVIRPVLDLSEIQNGQARIGSILGTNSYSFSPDMSYSMNRVGGVVQAAGDVSLRSTAVNDFMLNMRKEMSQINTDNRTIITALSRYLPYIPEISHMQVTLDKKTLVGELVPAIDAKLGDVALRRR